MSRISLVQKEQASPEVKELFQKIENNGARVANLYKVVGHSPHVVRNFIKLGNSLIGRTELSPKLRELTIMRIAKLCHSECEWAQHALIALEAGVSQKKLDTIDSWKESDCFTEEERAVLQYVDEVAKNVKVTDEAFAALNQYLNERSIVELTLAIGWWGMVARVLVPLEVEIDEQTAGSAEDLIGRRSTSK
jgi:alkylhydroperoxidase family enzyme